MRKRIAQYENETFDDDLSIDEIIITNGATEGLILSMWTLLKENTNIVLPTPGYTLYQSQASLSGAGVRLLDTISDNFQIDED